MIPLTISDILVCPHGGRVVLQKQSRDLYQANYIPILTIDDLAGSTILDCPYIENDKHHPCLTLSKGQGATRAHLDYIPVATIELVNTFQTNENSVSIVATTALASGWWDIL